MHYCYPGCVYPECSYISNLFLKLSNTLSLSLSLSLMNTNLCEDNYDIVGYCRLVFRSSSSAKEWVQKNKYFHILSKGVERDGWKFVLLARFSPMPSYVINYALAATRVGFIVDFLLPTVIGCLPMIMQNTSIGSLAGAAVASASGSQKSQVWSYLFPALGIISSIFISLRIRKYSTDISLAEVSPSEHVHDSKNDDSSQNLSGELGSEGLKKNQ